MSDMTDRDTLEKAAVALEMCGPLMLAWPMGEGKRLAARLREMAATDQSARVAEPTSLLMREAINAIQDGLSRNHEIITLKARIGQLETERERLREALAELYALVMGECPALLDEDSGGSAQLGMLISEALKENGNDR